MAISAANRLGAGRREVLATPSEERAAGPRRVSILGSTGSVGQSTVDLLSRNRKDFTVEALTANNNAKLVPHMNHTVEITGDVTEKDGKVQIAANDLKMVK